MSDTQADILAARAEVNKLKAIRDERARDIMKDNKFRLDDVPPLEQLREERARLMGEIRHHKDEQDALALEIEDHKGGDEVHELAARLQRLEHFSYRAESYVRDELQQDVEALVAQDQRQSEEDIAAYIQELQSRREQTLKRIAAVQERSSRTARQQKAQSAEPVDEEQMKSIEHAVSNVEEGNALGEKLKKFRALRTKLQGDLAHTKRESKQADSRLTAVIKNEELSNARNLRLCKELTSQNASLTNNAQMLLHQLNMEHYGIDGAPSAKEVTEARKAREATPPSTAARSRSASFHQGSLGSQDSRSYAQSQGSRGCARPPLVALKPTASQKSRHEAIRAEREESSIQRQRGLSVASSDAHSAQSSRRQSLSKPPLVASKPTASQKIREDATQREREEASVGRHQHSHGTSVNSAGGRPSSNAGKSNVSPHSRMDEY